MEHSAGKANLKATRPNKGNAPLPPASWGAIRAFETTRLSFLQPSGSLSISPQDTGDSEWDLSGFARLEAPPRPGGGRVRFAGSPLALEFGEPGEVVAFRSSVAFHCAETWSGVGGVCRLETRLQRGMFRNPE